MDFELKPGSILEARGANGSYAAIDLAHYLAVKAVKEASGKPKPLFMEPHESIFTIGCRVVNQFTDELFTVENIGKKWFGGQYYFATLTQGSDYRKSVAIEVIDCVHPDIVREAESFKASFKLYTP